VIKLACIQGVRRGSKRRRAARKRIANHNDGDYGVIYIHIQTLSFCVINNSGVAKTSCRDEGAWKGLNISDLASYSRDVFKKKRNSLSTFLQDKETRVPQLYAKAVVFIKGIEKTDKIWRSLPLFQCFLEDIIQIGFGRAQVDIRPTNSGHSVSPCRVYRAASHQPVPVQTTIEPLSPPLKSGRTYLEEFTPDALTISRTLTGFAIGLHGQA